MNLTPPAIQAAPRTLQRSQFQGRVNGLATDLHTLKNASGATVSVCNYGARIVQIVMPNARGDRGDVALGFNDLAGLLRPSPQGVPSMGAFIGRYANRIGLAQLPLNGQLYSLAPNSGGHSLHGGPGGSRYQVFSAQQLSATQLELRHQFTPANDGFPGTLALTLTYTLSESNALSIAWLAQAIDAPTVASFTSHVFFNLCGAGSVNDHTLQLHASRFLPLNAQGLPTGDLRSTCGTPFDCASPTRLAHGLSGSGSIHPQIALCGGYDHHWAIDAWDGSLKTIGRVSEPSSGRTLEIFSTEPGVQVFTANGLDAAHCGFAKHSGLCVEPSYFPDSPKHAHFPSTQLAAGQSRAGQVVYAFGAV